MSGVGVGPVVSTGPKAGILALRDTIAKYFEEFSIQATVLPVGLKYRSFNLAQGPNGANRVVLIPGEFQGEPQAKARKYGMLSRETRNAGSGFNPRELLSWERPITISIWAGPTPGNNSDEGLNVARAEDLLEEVIRASQYFAHPDGSNAAGSLHWGQVMINAPPVENAFGAELLVNLVQIAPFYDVTYDYVQAKLVPKSTLT